LKESPNQQQPIIGLIGRVVPIKDIKNLIRAMVLVKQKIPGAIAWIIGPTDEDPSYFTECKELVDVLGLKEQVLFKGMQRVADILPQLDLLTLSSISEALPLVVLEAFDAGIPVVATDVGACRELLYGFDEADKKLGEGGIVVEIANADALANGILMLLADVPRWQRSQRAARERVVKYYSMEKFVESYRNIYERAMSVWQG
jgi:glycosyltransferase involved in cell wall biosynthesis